MSSLGDIILTEPITALVKSQYPDSVIEYLTKPTFKELVEMFPHVDKVHTEYKDIAYLKKLGHFDYAIDLHGKLSSYIAIKAVRAKQKYTYKKQHFLRQAIVAKRTDRTIGSTIDLYATAVSSFVNTKEMPFPKLIVPARKRNNERDVNLRVGVFPGASFNTKRWLTEYFKTTIDKLISEDGVEITLLGSKDEYDLCSSIAKMNPSRCENKAGEFSFRQLAEEVDKFDLLITNDSGPMHLASALSKPLIAIFGATHPKLGFAPLNDKAIVLTKDYPCQPCSLHGGDRCPLKHFRCMQDIKPNEVLKAVRKLIGVIDAERNS